MNQPIGSTSVRADGTRYIKVSYCGPPSKRWTQYARFLWETMRGPVPNGMRVIHKDGNAQNDDIRNLMVGTPADVLWIHCHANRKKSEANYRKAGKATAKMNRLRGEMNRMNNWLPSQWYAINVERQRAWNKPQRKPLAIAQALGLQVNGRKIWPVVLGYPDGDRAEAIIVRCLGPDLIRTEALFKSVQAFAQQLGFRPMGRNCMFSALVRLRKRGHIDGPRGAYRLTIQRPQPLAIVRGATIIKHFQRCCRCDSPADLML